MQSGFNVELYNFGKDNIVTCAVCGWYESDYNSDGKIADFNDGDLEAWFIHLSEGVDQTSRDEFDLLNSKGLLAQPTVVIHGTALTPSQFGQMAAVGSNLVWSPLSNLLLYGNTTDVRAADNAGVKISIAPDWGPSGSKSNLHELKVADMWNTKVMNDHFTNYEMAEMVTSNPAEAAKWGNYVGQIKAGMIADLVVIDTFHEDPYRNLIEAIDADIRLTLVQGKALFGDEDIMTSLKGDDWEPIQGGGVSKVVDITSTSVVDGSQSFASIEEGLSMAMRNELSDIREHWSEVADMSTDEEVQAYLDDAFDGDYRDGVSHLKNMTLDPIFTTGDERYFDVINRSSHANFHIDMSKLYDYYDVTYDADSNRPFIEDADFEPGDGGVVCPTDLCWDGSTRDPSDCSCPPEVVEPEPEPVNIKVNIGDYEIGGGFDGKENLTAKATANQLIIYENRVESTRYTHMYADNRYMTTDGSAIYLQTYDESSYTYTGVDWNGDSFTLTVLQNGLSDDDTDLESDSSNTDLLINLGIIAAIMVIILSGIAIVSMLRNPKGEASMQTFDEPMDDDSAALFEEAVEDEIED